MDAPVSGRLARTLPPNETCELLARRLRADTQGEVLFDDASRGRYATDASIYQIMPVGVFVPCTPDERDVDRHRPELKVLKLLARGAGASQCGQTTGAALVDRNHQQALPPRAGGRCGQARTATRRTQPVLDHLNAQLKALGLWFPVDVSASAQATLGGMAGNNSCGSRSIAYGNMVHNVLGASAWLSDGSLLDFGPVVSLGAREMAIAEHVRGLAEQHRAEMIEHWPKVMRRVAGYNLDIFDNQSERPYTRDGSVNLAHLLIGSEGTLAFTRSLTLKLAELPRAKVLGVVNFPGFRAAMDAAQHLVRAGPHGGRAGGPHDDRAELCGNPAFRPVMETRADRSAGGDSAGRFAGADEPPDCCPKQTAGRADG